MDRVYINHRRGERRIHIELDEADVHAVADANPDALSRCRTLCAETARQWTGQDGTDGQA